MVKKSVEKIGQHLKLITSDIKLYIEKRIELFAINIGEQYVRWVAQSMQKIAGLVLIFGGIIFLLFALAFYLGALLHNLGLGFVLASLPLLFSGFMLFNLKPKSISRKIRSELEEELTSIFKADYDREEAFLIDQKKSQENKKEKEQDG